MLLAALFASPSCWPSLEAADAGQHAVRDPIDSAQQYELSNGAGDFLFAGAGAWTPVSNCAVPC
jgi:hypothetical protein